jgi:hypothetical protein
MLLFETLNPNVLRVAKVISCDSGQDFDKWNEKNGFVLDIKLNKNQLDAPLF